MSWNQAADDPVEALLSRGEPRVVIESIVRTRRLDAYDGVTFKVDRFELDGDMAILKPLGGALKRLKWVGVFVEDLELVVS